MTLIMEGGTKKQLKKQKTKTKNKNKGYHPESNQQPQASRLYKQFHNMSHKPLHYQQLTIV